MLVSIVSTAVVMLVVIIVLSEVIVTGYSTVVVKVVDSQTVVAEARVSMTVVGIA